jgi:hypothetical protein
VVGCGFYRIVGDSLAHNYQKTILMTRTACFVIKIVKPKLEGDNTFPQCYDVFASFIFIELSNSCSGDNLTPLLSLMKLIKIIFESNFLKLLEPSTPLGSVTVLPRHRHPLGFIIWVICGVCKMIVRTLCTLPFAMKQFGAINLLIF